MCAVNRLETRNIYSADSFTTTSSNFNTITSEEKIFVNQLRTSI